MNMKLKLKKVKHALVIKRKAVKQVKVKKKKWFRIIMPTVIEKMRPNVWYLAPSCLVLVKAGYKDEYRKGDRVSFSWKNQWGATGIMDLPQGYPVIKHTEKIYKKYRVNKKLRDMWQEKVRIATLNAWVESKPPKSVRVQTGRPKIKLKLEPKKKLKLKIKLKTKKLKLRRK